MNRYHLLVLALAGAVACAGSAPGPEPPALAVAVPYEHASLDPHGDGTLSLHIAPFFDLYEALVATDTDLRVQPALARTWSTIDEHTWHFELRPARFHSGRPLAAADVVASLERARRPDRDTSYYLQDVESVRAVGPSTVEVRTRWPAPRLLNRLSFVMIVPAGASDLSSRVDGTGPYTVDSWVPGRTLTLRRHEAWWGAPPPVARATLHFDVSGEEASRGMLDGDFHIAQLRSGFDPSAVATSPRHRIVEHEDFYVTYLAWSLSRGSPFSDRRVRAAIALSIDREQLAAALPRRAHPARQLVTQHVFGFDPGLPLPTPQPGRSRALLAQAGQPDGIEATLTVRGRYRDAARALAAMLAPAGVRLSVEVEADQRYFDRLQRRELSMWLDNWGCTTGDAAELFENALHSPDGPLGYGRFNESGWSDPELDRRIEAAARLEADERRDALQQIMRMVLEEHVLVPLYTDVDTFAVDRDYEWRPRTDSSIRVAEVRPRR